MRRQIELVIAVLLVQLSATTADAASLVGLGNVIFFDGGIVGDLSARGDRVVVTEFIDGVGDRAVIWDEGVRVGLMEDLASGDVLSSVTGLSADGRTAAGSIESSGPAGGFEAAIWREGAGIQRLGFPTDPLSGNAPRESFASRLSADGSTILGTASGSESGRFNFAWTTDDGFVDLPDEACSDCVLNSVSADGRMLITPNAEDLLLWDPKSGELDPVSGFSSINRQVSTLSDDATTIVGANFTDSGTAPFRWTEADGTLRLFEPGPSFSFFGQARDVSADGSVVVGGYELPDGSFDRRSFIWTEERGFLDLEVFLELAGVDTSEWELLASAWGISGDGGTIVGTGYRTGSLQAETFVATIPEPSFALLLATGLIWLAGMKNRSAESE